MKEVIGRKSTKMGLINLPITNSIFAVFFVGAGVTLPLLQDFSDILVTVIAAIIGLLLVIVGFAFIFHGFILE